MTSESWLPYKRRAVTESIPEDKASDQSVGRNTVNAGQALGGAVGGTVKGIVDTTGNTVGTLGEGLAGTVAGLGKGLGSAAAYTGSALDGVGRGIGSSIGLGGKSEISSQVKDDQPENTSKETAQRDHNENIQALEDFEKNEGIAMKTEEPKK